MASRSADFSETRAVCALGQARVDEEHLRPHALADVAGMLRTELTWRRGGHRRLLDRRRARLVLG